MALMQPQGVAIPAFDARVAQVFSFTVQGGDQVIANRLTIKDNSNGNVVYNNKITSYTYNQTLPANTLTNNKTYTFEFQTYNVANESSEYSSPIIFKTYIAPTLAFINLPTPSETTHIVESASFNAQCQYTQINGESINFLNLYLYDTNRTQLSFIQYTISDATSVTSTSALFEYNYTGLIDDETYYIRAVGETVNGTIIDTDFVPISIDYLYEGDYYNIQATNYANGGYVKVINNISEVDGKVYDMFHNEVTPTFLSNSYILLENKTELIYPEGYQISNSSFVKQKWWFPIMLGETTRIYQDDNHTNTYISVEFKRGQVSGHIYDYLVLKGYQDGVQYMQKVSDLIEPINQTVQVISYVKIDGDDITFRFQLANIAFGAEWNGDSNLVLDGNYTNIDWVGEGDTGDYSDSYIDIDTMESNVEWGRLTNIFWINEQEAEITETDIINAPPHTTELYKTVLKNGIVNEFYITKNLSSGILANFPEWDNYTIMLCDFSNTVNAGNVEWVLNSVDKIKLKRKLKTALNSEYITIYEKDIETAYDLSFIYKDYYVASGRDYTYVMIPCAGNVEQTYLFTADVHTKFNGLFISDNGKTMKLYSNYGITTAQDNTLIGLAQPYNSQYPIIVKNPYVLYSTYGFQGDILGINENQDDDGCVITNFELTDQTRVDIVTEQNKWKKFLANGKTKIVKDWNGNIIMGQVTTTPNYSYNQTSGNSKPTMSFTITEVGRYDSQYDLYSHGLLDFATASSSNDSEYMNNNNGYNYNYNNNSSSGSSSGNNNNQGGNNSSVVISTNGVKIENIDFNGVSNKTLTLVTSKYYKIIDSSNADESIDRLAVSIDNSQTSASYESPNYHFSFISGTTPTELILPYNVYVPSNFDIEANTYYDIYINPYTYIVTYYSKEVDA